MSNTFAAPFKDEQERVQDIYHEAWLLYYTPSNMKILLRRAAATGRSDRHLAKYLLTFSTTDALKRYIPPGRDLPPQATSDRAVRITVHKVLPAKRARRAKLLARKAGPARSWLRARTDALRWTAGSA